MPNTTHARGSFLDGRINLEGWWDFCGSDAYSPEDVLKMGKALLDAQIEYINSVLPEGFWWSHGTSEIIGPVDGRQYFELEEFEETFRTSGEIIADRFEEIERETLGRSE